MRTRSRADWLSALESAKVPCGPINSLAEVFDRRIREPRWLPEELKRTVAEIAARSGVRPSVR